MFAALDVVAVVKSTMKRYLRRVSVNQGLVAALCLSLALLVITALGLVSRRFWTQSGPRPGVLGRHQAQKITALVPVSQAQRIAPSPSAVNDEGDEGSRTEDDGIEQLSEGDDSVNDDDAPSLQRTQDGDPIDRRGVGRMPGRPVKQLRHGAGADTALRRKSPGPSSASQRHRQPTGAPGSSGYILE